MEQTEEEKSRLKVREQRRKTRLRIALRDKRIFKAGTWFIWASMVVLQIWLHRHHIRRALSACCLSQSEKDCGGVLKEEMCKVVRTLIRLCSREEELSPSSEGDRFRHFFPIPYTLDYGSKAVEQSTRGFGWNEKSSAEQRKATIYPSRAAADTESKKRGRGADEPRRVWPTWRTEWLEIAWVWVKQEGSRALCVIEVSLEKALCAIDPYPELRKCASRTSKRC